MDLSHLNIAQRQAVEAKLGNLLVLAGAGSGKTRVLVNRIAWLIENNYATLHNILAVTFTNKAASEIKSRLASILNQNTASLWVGTFHSLAHRFLRLHWQTIGLSQNFQIIDSDDQQKVIRKLCKQLNIDEEKWELKQIQNFINRKKDDGVRANKLLAANNFYERVMQDVYLAYEKFCINEGVLDFGELLFLAYEGLKDDESLQSHYQARFSHFLVDEFQDTNTIQYNWLKILAAKASSVTVVGDDDQSIYGWRGARVENIYKFEKDYPETKIIRLEQNYRSTNMILSAANAVIACNDGRLGKKLWTTKTEGEKVTLYAALNEEDEAFFVVKQIQKYLSTINSFKSIAILYRSNAQSRAIEEALVRSSIPYSIYGGVRFFERAEIKDALAYLKLVVNKDDNIAFERVINTPARGIGEQSLNKIKTLAIEKGVNYWQATKSAIDHNILTGKAGVGALAFINIIESLSDVKIDSVQDLSSLIEQLINASGLLKFFKEKPGERARSRVENLEELVSAADHFPLEQIGDLEDEFNNIVANFLSYASLEAGEHKDNVAEGVQLMTLHSAKGLEFPIVFICGVEEGLFPHHYSKNDPQALEEERRLCYVGITRAMSKLFMTYAEKRRLFGREEIRKQSRFIQEIPAKLLDEQSGNLYIRKNYPFAYSSTRSSSYTNKAKSSSYIKTISKKAVYSNLSNDDPYDCLGQRVKHTKFGIGTVVDQEGSGDKMRVNVHFDNAGPKWLVMSLAKLEVLS